MLGVTNPWILPKVSRLCYSMNAIACTEWIMDNECFIPHILLLFMNCPVANHISHNHLLSNFHKLVLVCSSIAHSTSLLITIINWFLHRLVLLTLRWQNIAFFPWWGEHSMSICTASKNSQPYRLNFFCCEFCKIAWTCMYLTNKLSYSKELL